tara:strand:+ start:985 stop:1647 length:663 start_codon:yes stop_codon:yes gene_type:complete
MISNKELTAIIPVRSNSQRVKNKNIKKFSSSNLIEIKIKELQKVSKIDQIILTSDSKEMLDIGKKFKVKVHKREKYYASSEATNSEFFSNLADISKSDYILYSPVTSPLISFETINDCINYFETEKLKNLATTSLIKHHLWLNGKPLNYQIDKSPSSQDLPDIHSINYACCIIERGLMKQNKNVVSKHVVFKILDEIESTDIDTELDFLKAEYIYNKFRS